MGDKSKTDWDLIAALLMVFVLFLFFLSLAALPIISETVIKVFQIIYGKQ